MRVPIEIARGPDVPGRGTYTTFGRNLEGMPAPRGTVPASASTATPRAQRSTTGVEPSPHSGRLVMRRRQRRLNAAKRRRRLPHHTPTLMWLQWWERRLDPFLSAVAPFLSVGRADRTCQSASSLPSPATSSTPAAAASACAACNSGVASEAGAEAGSGLRQLLPSLLPTHARLRVRRADAQRRRARRAYHPCASATAQRRGLGQQCTGSSGCWGRRC